MTPLTRRDVLTHQAAVPWPSQRQVEQDLLLCRAMAALFNDRFLHTQIAMRGGTLLHKIYLESFQHYLRQEGTGAGRAEFVEILESHLDDRGFCSDLDHLLRTGVTYDPRKAGEYVIANLLSLLP